jgi:hypothetical protein
MTLAGIRCGLAAVVCVLAGTAPAAAAVEGPCAAWFNGVDADRVGSLSSPLLLGAAESLAFSGTDEGTTRRAEVSVLLGPVTLGRSASSQSTAASEFAASLDLSDVAPYGVGLLRIRATTDNCTIEAWLRVGGRLPLTTLAGVGGAALALAGLTGQAAALIARRRWSRWVAGGSGLFTGAGVALLGQQLGRLQISYWSLAACVALAAAVGLGLALLLRRRGAKDQAEPTGRAEPTGQRSGTLPGAETPLPAPEAIARPFPAAAPPSPEEGAPHWCYVTADTKVLHLDDYARVVATLHPGTWYLAKREVSNWAQVEAAAGVEGWVPRRALHREG